MGALSFWDSEFEISAVQADVYRELQGGVNVHVHIEKIMWLHVKNEFGEL